jgi:hypothetical protein
MTSEPPPTPLPLATRPELPAGAPLPPEALAEQRRLGPDGLPRWPAWTPLPALLLTFITALVGTLAIVVLVELTGREVDSSQLPPGVTIGGTMIQDLALIGSAVLFARTWAGGVRLADFGIRRTPLRQAIGWTVLTWFAFLAFSAAWAAIFDITENDDLPRELGADESTAALIGVMILVTLLAPVCEEFFFRGFCFTALRRSFGVALGAALTGVIFGLIHAGGSEPEFLVPLGVLGALLCLLYWRTGSIIPCMVLHALNNSIALGVALGWEPVAIAATMLASSGLIVAVAVALAARGPGVAAARA